ncbi:MAG: MerR family transcriptional regulator [Cyanobacteriota bacterium]|nr:MerR family transcriptional regulator [Cyanobacteriota bacterium]
MESLPQLAQSQPQWTLREFVETLNGWLPQFLPENPANTRVREDVTPRLVRHYTSLGMVDEALKQGREARYTYRHFLQMLVVRRLLSEGYGAEAIGDLAKTKENRELELLLEGGVQLTVTAANPALGFLQQIKQRRPSPSPDSSSAKRRSRAVSSGKSIAPPTPTSNPTQWTRIDVLPGLELHVREDFTYPNSPQEQQNLLQHLTHILLTFAKNRRSK